MGIWTAVGLVVAWGVAFTLFPSLQRALRTPTRRSVAVRSAAYERLARSLPAFTYRHRWPLVASPVAVCFAGVVAVFGLPGVARGLSGGVGALDYLDHRRRCARTSPGSASTSWT